MVTRKSLKISLKFRIFSSFCLCKLSSKFCSAFGLFDSAYLSLRGLARSNLTSLNARYGCLPRSHVVRCNDRQKLFHAPSPIPFALTPFVILLMTCCKIESFVVLSLERILSIKPSWLLDSLVFVCK